MATILVLEIDKRLLTNKQELIIKDKSKFYEVFKNKVIVILYNNDINQFDCSEFGFGENINIEMYRLNHFARNRMINNFEDERPELTLYLMGCNDDSRLIKIWEKHVKR